MVNPHTIITSEETSLDRHFEKMLAEMGRVADSLGIEMLCMRCGCKDIHMSNLDECRTKRGPVPTQGILLPFGASQTAGCGKLVPVWYSMFVLDFDHLFDYRHTADFDTLCQGIMECVHGFRESGVTSFLSKWLVIYNDMTVETTSRRIKISHLENTSTATFQLWTMKNSQIVANDESGHSRFPQLKGDSSDEAPVEPSDSPYLNARQDLTDDFAERWSFE